MKNMLLYWVLGPIAGALYGVCYYVMFFTDVGEKHQSLLSLLFFAGLLLIGLALWCFWRIFQYAKKRRITWQKIFMMYLLIAGGLNIIVFYVSFIKR